MGIAFSSRSVYIHLIAGADEIAANKTPRSSNMTNHNTKQDREIGLDIHVDVETLKDADDNPVTVLSVWGSMEPHPLQLESARITKDSTETLAEATEAGIARIRAWAAKQ